MESSTEEIIPGIFIHKSILTSSSIPSSIGTYIFKMEVKLMKVVTVDIIYENSKNIEIQNSEKVIINPYENKEIAKITLFKNWAFTPKYNIEVNSLPKENVKTYIKNDVIEINNSLKKCYEKLNNIQLELMSPIEIQNLFEEKKIEKFIDYEFPPNNSSMKSKKYINSIEEAIHWKRPENFILLNNEKNIESKIIIENPEPNDIIQESLDDNNFISSISCIAEKSNLIKRLFISENISKHGIYLIKLCIKGKWKTIIIDDFFPCFPNGNPIVSHSPSNEIWVLLLEKALAKIYGSYYDLHNIKIADFFILLTGCPSFLFLKDEFYDIYNKIYDYVINKNYLVMGIKRIDDNEIEDNDYNSMFIPNIGYTILNIKDKGDKKFFLLRKILYSSEQQVLIDDHQNNLFDNYPDLKEISIPGTIILDFEDFIKEFSYINICYARNWEEIRMKGKFILTNSNNYNIISNNFYYFEIEKDSNIIISLFQDEDSNKDIDSRKPIMDISLSVFKYDNNTSEIFHIQTIDFSLTPSIQIELNLPSGSYIIFPRTSGCFIGKNNNNKTNLQDIDGSLSDIFINVIKDIFEKYDINQNNILSYKEFNSLMVDMTNNKIGEIEFNNLIRKYDFNRSGLTEKNLIKYFEISFLNGEKKIREWLKNLGYNNDLYCNKSRNFMVTIHSNNSIIAKIQDSLITGINDKLNKILLKYFGKEKENVKKQEISILLLKSKLDDSMITLGCRNNTNKRKKVTLTFKDLKGIISCGRKEGTRIINGNDLEYFMQFYIINCDDLDNIDFNIQIIDI